VTVAEEKELMSENTGGVPPRDPEHPDEHREEGDLQPPAPPVPPAYGQPSVPPAYGDPSGPPAYGQYAPPGYTSPESGYGLTRDDGPVRVGSAFSWAWASFGRSAGAWLGATLVVLAIGVAASLLLTPSTRDVTSLDDLNALMGGGLTLTDRLLAAVVSVVNFVLGAVLVHGALAATRQGRARFGDFFALRNVGGILLLALITALISLVLAYVQGLGGLLQLVVSFFLVAAIFFVVDKEQDAITAIRSSVRLVAGNIGTVLLTVLLAFVITLAGALLLGVGLLVALPISVLLGAYVYRRLVGEPVSPA
jgi:uncharacterized membrane protein